MLRRVGHGLSRGFSAVIAVLDVMTGFGVGRSSPRGRPDDDRLDEMERLVLARERGEIDAREFARRRSRLHGS